MDAPAQKVLYDNEARLNEVARDFRSDTFTIPTVDMFSAMAQASRGDDTYAEDETTQEFQKRMAKLTGKEAGLFCISGTMTNQVALRTHLVQPPHAVIMDHRAHIHINEAGGLAYHSQATSVTLVPSNGRYLRWEEDIKPVVVIGDDNIHLVPTKVIELENTLSGTIFPQEEVEKISREARKLGIIMHMDGARIFETAAATGLTLKQLCDPFDSVSLCLSKGIGAPIGSILVGSEKFIYKALRFRKIFGGSVRQGGLIVAAAEYALDTHMPLLKGAHDLAQKLALGLSELGVKITIPVQTNMVFYDCTTLGFSHEDLQTHLAKSNNKITINTSSRLVVHHQTSAQAIQDFISAVRELKAQYNGKDTPLPEAELVESRGFSRGEFFPRRT